MKPIFLWRLLSDREIQRLKTHIPSDFSETAAAVLTAGCLRLSAVLYRSCKELLLGYDVFVKDDPASPEWIFYNSLSEPVSLKETDMLRVLDAQRRSMACPIPRAASTGWTANR